MDTTLAAPAAASTGSSDSGGSYVQSLSGAADPQSVDGVLSSDPGSLETGGQNEEVLADAPGVDAGADPAAQVDGEFDRMAKEAGFEDTQNLNPAQRLALKNLIARMQAPAQDGKAALENASTDSPVEELTELEKEIAAASQPEKVAASAEQKATQPAAAQSQPQQGYGDIGDKWQGPNDAYAELSEAYQAGDLARVHQIDSAMLVRRFDQMLRPAIDRQIQAGVQEALKKMGVTNVIPQVEKDLQERRTTQNKELAQKNVARLPGNEGFLKMFDPVEAGKTVTFRGGQYPDTPYNRIMIANPELLNIRVQHDDPNIAEQLTHVAIYKAAARLHRQSQQQQNSIQPAQAKALVQAGAKIAAPSDTDRTRQTLNAGVGATGAGSGIGKNGKPTSYIADINRPAGELTLTDLLR